MVKRDTNGYGEEKGQRGNGSTWECIEIIIIAEAGGKAGRNSKVLKVDVGPGQA